jgi:hypothetical protein
MQHSWLPAKYPKSTKRTFRTLVEESIQARWVFDGLITQGWNQGNAK